MHEAIQRLQLIEFGIGSGFRYVIKGRLEVNCCFAKAGIVDFSGLLDRIKEAFCVQALVCAF